MRIVSYIRVSDKKQRAGFGLDAQRAAIAAYCALHGAEIVQEYVEVEHGWKNDRPELDKALLHARSIGAKLVVAKLDRLSRNLNFVTALMESGVDFVACDIPSANKFTIHVMAAMAQQEVEFIQTRTREGLAIARQNGVALGAQIPKVAEALKTGRRKKRAGTPLSRRIRRANKLYADILPLVRALRQRDVSWDEIAVELNRQGFCRPGDREWSKKSVWRAFRGLETVCEKV